MSVCIKYQQSIYVPVLSVASHRETTKRIFKRKPRANGAGNGFSAAFEKLALVAHTPSKPFRSRRSLAATQDSTPQGSLKRRVWERDLHTKGIICPELTIESRGIQTPHANSNLPRQMPLLLKLFTVNLRKSKDKKFHNLTRRRSLTKPDAESHYCSNQTACPSWAANKESSPCESEKPCTKLWRARLRLYRCQLCKWRLTSQDFSRSTTMY